MALPIVSAPVAAAAPGPVYGTFTDLAGTGGAYRGTMTLAPGFPAATFTSTSRSGPGVGPQSGTTAWLPAGSPPGVVYGSSQNQAYLNLRPASDSAASPSVTTYTFARPTPTAGWSFILGDIDADEVTVSATTADGSAVPVAALGFARAFNYCDASPRLSSCSGVGAPYDLPSWDPGTATLTGNSGASDTTGAAGWFSPTVPIKTLTFSYRGRSGVPVYQTWFATQTRSVAGTVTAGGSGLAGVTVEIVDGDGAVVGTVTTGADGTYSRDGLAPGAYTVRVVTPDGYAPVGSSRRTADLSAGDATTVDFALAQVADLSVIKKLDTDPVVAGEPITYTLTATNAGPADATGVSVVDTVPPGLTGVSGQVTGGAACVVDAALLTCPVGALIVGTSATVQVTGTVSATAPAGVAMLNQAAVTADQPDPNPGNNRASAAARVTAAADLALVKTFTRTTRSPAARSATSSPSPTTDRRGPPGWPSPTRWTRG